MLYCFFRHMLHILTIFTLCFEVSAKVLTLEEAVACAIESNAQIKSAFLDSQLHLSEIRILKKSFSPKFSFNIGATAQNEDYFNQDFVQKKLHAYPSMKLATSFGTQFELFTEHNVGYERDQKSAGSALHIVIEQPLLKGRRRAVNRWPIDSAHIAGEIQTLLFNKAISQLVLRVTLAYHALELAQKNVRLYEMYLHEAQRSYEAVSLKIESGRASKNDLLSAQLQINQANHALVQAHFEYEVALDTLSAIVDIPRPFSIVSTSGMKRDLCWDNREDFASAVKKHDIESKVFMLKKDKIRKEIEVKQDKERWDLKLRGDWTLGRYHVWGLNNAQNLNDTSPFDFPFVHNNGNYSAHLQLSIPLSQKQETQHQLYASRVALEKIDLEYRDHLILLENHINSALGTLDLKRRQMELSQESIVLAKKKLEDTMLNHEMGRKSLSDVVTAQEKLLNAKIKHDVTKMAMLDVISQLECLGGVLGAKWG